MTLRIQHACRTVPTDPMTRHRLRHQRAARRGHTSELVKHRRSRGIAIQIPTGRPRIDASSKNHGASRLPAALRSSRRRQYRDQAGPTTTAANTPQKITAKIADSNCSPLTPAKPHDRHEHAAHAPPKPHTDDRAQHRQHREPPAPTTSANHCAEENTPSNTIRDHDGCRSPDHRTTHTNDQQA